MSIYNKNNLEGYLREACSTNLDEKLLAFPEGYKAQHGFKYYTKRDLIRLTDKVAAYYAANGVPIRQAGDNPLKIAFLAYGTIEWAVSFFAVAKMGHSIVCLSSRLSEEYTRGLIAKSNPDMVVTDRKVPLSERMKVIQMPTEEQIEQQPLKDELHLFCEPSVIRPSDILWYNHSSGSTSLPKLFPIPHSEWIQRLAAADKFVLPDQSVWVASAMYNFAALLVISLCWNKTAVVYFENDRTEFTQEGILKFLEESRPQFLGLTPWTLQMLAASPRGVQGLVNGDTVMMFGAVLSDELGDRLVKQGVNLFSNYALTEAFLTVAAPPPRKTGDHDWQYVAIPPSKKEFIKMRLHPGSDELYEMWCTPDCPSVLEQVRDKDGWFCTGDLFLKHPIKEDRWKIIGRQDDQIKIYQHDRQVVIDAVVYEKTIAIGNDDAVDEVVLFGQGRPALGLLVFAEDVAPGSDRRQQVEQRIWNTVQARVNNGKLPTSIERNMIIVVDVKRKTLPQTYKFNLIRPQIYRKYEQLIAKAYADAEQEKMQGKHMNGEREHTNGEREHTNGEREHSNGVRE